MTDSLSDRSLNAAEIGVLTQVFVGAEAGGANIRHLSTVLESSEADATVSSLIDRGVLELSSRDVLAIADGSLAEDVGSTIEPGVHQQLHRQWARAAACLPSPVIAATTRANHLICSGDVDAAIGQLTSAADMLGTSGRHVEALTLLERAVGLVSNPPVKLLERRAATAAHANEPGACELWLEIADVHRALGCREDEARARCQAHFANRRSNAPLDAAASIGGDVGWALYARAVKHVNADDYDRAIPLDQRALAIARTNEDRLLESAILDHLGLSYLELHQGDEAIEMLQCARDLALSLDDPHSVIRSSVNLAVNLVDDLRLAEALEALRIASGFAESTRIGHERSAIDNTLAHVLMSMGRISSADRLADAAIARLPQEAGDQVAWAVAFDHALVKLRVGQVDAASRSVERAEREAAVLSFRSFAFETRFARAQLDAAGDDFEAALHLVGNPDIGEPHSLALLALWATRTGVLKQRDDLLHGAGSLRRTIGSTWPLITRYSTEEIDAIDAARQSGDVDPLLERARRWRHRDAHLHSLEATVVAGVIAAKHGARSSAIDLLTGAHSALVECGDRFISRIAADWLDRLAAESGTGQMSLASVDAFASLGRSALSALQQFAASGTCDRDTILVDADLPPDALFILKSGSVKVFRNGPDDRELIVVVLDAGDMFGTGVEPAGGVTVQALEGCVYWSIPAPHLERLTHSHPEIGMALLSVAHRRLALANQLAGSLAFHSIDERLALLLIDLDERYGRSTLDGGRIIDRTISHDAMASMIGAARITVTLGLKRLRERDIIGNRKRKIVIRDAAALRAIVDGPADEAA